MHFLLEYRKKGVTKIKENLLTISTLLTEYICAVLAKASTSLSFQQNKLCLPAKTLGVLPNFIFFILFLSVMSYFVWTRIFQLI